MAQMVERPACGLNNRRTGIDYQQGHGIFFCHSKTSRPAVVPTKPLIQGVPREGESGFGGGG